MLDNGFGFPFVHVTIQVQVQVPIFDAMITSPPRCYQLRQMPAPFIYDR